MKSPALSSGAMFLTAPFTPVKVSWYKKLATFLFERIHLHAAGKIARRCSLVSAKSVTCLFVYYSISILNALCSTLAVSISGYRAWKRGGKPNRKHLFKNGNYEDIVCLVKFSEDWEDSKIALKARCFGAEGK